MMLARSTSTIPAGAAGPMAESCGPVKMEGENIQ